MENEFQKLDLLGVLEDKREVRQQPNRGVVASISPATYLELMLWDLNFLDKRGT